MGLQVVLKVLSIGGGGGICGIRSCSRVNDGGFEDLGVRTTGPVSICAPVRARKLALNASVWGPEWWRRVCRPRTEVVAVAATTTATCRWTGGVCGRGVGSVGGADGMGSSSRVQMVEARLSPTHRSRRRRRHHHRHL
jgi:hypothetical protein